ncbi:DUF2905 domain-containing protein [Methylocucumis oryzae]|uniref:DUF2905 domain-containing protein n=1 Tax=Methylocucumis oryzae TaxID=1632867 RepID=A0A0F3IJH3_9GAMM|nr:DUF2905 domain-containing protein [Methylocucumis oryzae]KJV06856.1 hypothetical protein VZ94_08610 [Methylocucumis oryzae]
MSFAKLITIAGIALVFIGIALQYAPWLLNWFGRLPGDIRIKNEHSFIFMPITSMLIISVIFSIVMALLRR